MPLGAMLFDLDGTITRPLLDFPTIKREIGLPPDALILEALETMTPEEREQAMLVVERHEREAARRSELNDGAAALLAELDRRGIATGIITRNSAESTATVIERHGLSFGVVICRDHAPPKPSPDGLRLALAALRVEASHAAFVGDHRIDVEAGHAAGMRTVWVSNGSATEAPVADFTAATPGDIVALLDEIAAR